MTRVTKSGVVPLALALLVVACSADSESTPAATASAPTEADAPPADPTDVTYVQWRDTAFTVIENAEADALFEEVTGCTSEELGFAVDYPASWHTNEGGQAPGCSWFGPEPFAHAPAMLVALVRPDVPIRLSVVQTGLGQIPEHPRLLSKELTLAGRDAVRSEDVVPIEPAWWSYGYAAWLDDDPLGWKFIATTSSLAEGDYHLNKAVLDRMMATLELRERAGRP